MSFPHRGRALGELMEQYDHMVLAGMLCEDTATGRVRTIDGRPQAFYQLADADAANLQRGVVAALRAAVRRRREADHAAVPRRGGSAARPTTRAACSISAIPARGWEVVTVHMMGTARDGHRSHAAPSPIAFGFVHDADRLMVADASLFPTPIGVNPMETIMALATRAARRT